MAEYRQEIMDLEYEIFYLEEEDIMNISFMRKRNY